MARNTFCSIVVKIDNNNNNNNKYAHIIDTHMPTTLVQVFDSSWIHFNFHCHLSLVSLKSFQTTILTVHMEKYKTQWYVISHALFFLQFKKKAALKESRCTRDWSTYVKPYIFLDNLQKINHMGCPYVSFLWLFQINQKYELICRFISLMKWRSRMIPKSRDFVFLRC